MPATPTYGFRYPSTSDSPHGPDQIRFLAEDVEAKTITVDADTASLEELLKGYAAPTQTGSGVLAVGGNGLVVMSVAITDPGFSYRIYACGSIGWNIPLASAAGNLLEGAITIDSTVYITNRLIAGYVVSHSLLANATQPTLHIAEKRSDVFGVFVGAKTVRLMARNSGGTSFNIPANGPDTSLSVRIVPA